MRQPTISPTGGTCRSETGRTEAMADRPARRVGRRISSSAVMPALRHTLTRFACRCEYLDDVIDGCEGGSGAGAMQDFATLYRYCYRVASAVGLACIHIWGFRGERAKLSGRARGRRAAVDEHPSRLAGRLGSCRASICRPRTWSASSCEPEASLGDAGRELGAVRESHALRRAAIGAANYASARPN